VDGGVKMFDLWIESVRKKMFGKLESELDEDEKNGKSDKVLHFLIRVLPSILVSIIVFLGFLYIFSKIADKYGIDRVLIGFGVIFMLLFRGILKALNEILKTLKGV
jgi:hypothetical protein